MSVGCLRWQVMFTDRPGKGNKPALWGSPAWGNAWVFHRYLRSVSPVRKISHLLFPLSSSTATTGKSPNLPSPRLIRAIQPSIPPHHRMSASLLASKMNHRAFTTVRCSRTWTLTETRSNVSSLVETRMDRWMVEILANNHWCVCFYTDSEHSIQCKECTSVVLWPKSVRSTVWYLSTSLNIFRFKICTHRNHPSAFTDSFFLSLQILTLSPFHHADGLVPLSDISKVCGPITNVFFQYIMILIF